MPEKKHRDHRELGQLLDLFSFHETAPGAPFWHGKGMIIFRELEKLARQINDANGYEEISTPILVKTELFKKSGHWEHYKDNMFHFKNPRDENEDLALKPMNCPESTYVYNSRVRSYRDLPLRLAEIGRLHRNELSGTLGGMFRVRQITMDDAHIYCRPDQVETEMVSIIKIIETFYKIFDFKPTYILATKPEKSLGIKKDWDLAEKALANALKKSKIKFKMAPGEGAFYGPKVEFHLMDSQGRDWQMGTVQLDLTMLPQRFDVHYIDENGDKKMPWVIHRAVFGSFERFIGMLLEHLDGNLPTWLSPVQVTVINISDKHLEYAQKVADILKKEGVRVHLNDQKLTVSKKIREAEVQQIPFILVVGDRELAETTVSVRENGKDRGAIALKDFTKEVIKKTSLPIF